MHYSYTNCPPARVRSMVVQTMVAQSLSRLFCSMQCQLNISLTTQISPKASMESPKNCSNFRVAPNSLKPDFSNFPEMSTSQQIPASPPLLKKYSIQRRRRKKENGTQITKPHTFHFSITQQAKIKRPTTNDKHPLHLPLTTVELAAPPIQNVPLHPSSQITETVS